MLNRLHGNILPAIPSLIILDGDMLPKNTAGNGRAYMSAYTSISGMGRLFLEAALNL